MLRLFLLILFCFLPLGIQYSFAQQVELSGQIEDAFLEMPLGNVRVALYDESKGVKLDTAKTLYLANTQGNLIATLYFINVKAEKRKYWICAERQGYTTVWQPVEITNPSVEKVELPVLKMRKSTERNLGEAVVSATRIKMYYKGDTLVYNADAFQLPEGSMLDDLIKQMPGVTMNQSGEIYVNGRKVDELLLASRSFMGGNKKVLMENLPYFTVKDIKVYEKQSDRSVALGYDVDSKSYVMDVQLKNQYTNGYVANLEAAGGTRERWLARAFVLGFTDRWRYSFMGNTNNVNESRHIGEQGHWTPQTHPKSLVTTYSAATDLNYLSKNKAVENNLNLAYTSTDTEQETHTRRELFMEGCRPVSSSQSRMNTDNWSVRAQNRFTYKKGFFLNSSTDFRFDKHGQHAWSQLEQSDNDALTLAQRHRMRGAGHTLDFSESVNGMLNLNRAKKQNLSYSVHFGYRQEESWSAQRYDLWNIPTQTRELRHNTIDFSSHLTRFHLQAVYHSPKFLGHMCFMVNEELGYVDVRNSDYLYHPDTLLAPSELDMLEALTDPGNSYRSHRRQLRNQLDLCLYSPRTYKLSPNAPVNIRYDLWRLGVKIPVTWQKFRYQRAVIDTLLYDTRTSFIPYGELNLRMHQGRNNLHFRVEFEKKPNSLLNRLAIRDDRSPLVVKLNNPALKEKAQTSVQIDYQSRKEKYLQNWGLEARLTYLHRDVVQSVKYNATSGVYTYRPLNVRGAYSTSGRFHLTRSFDKRNYWTWQFNVDADFYHSIDHAMLDGEMFSRAQAVNTTWLGSNTYVQYSRDQLNFRVLGDVKWRHSAGKMRDFDQLTAWDYHYGLYARYTLPVLRTTLSLDAVMYSRRGYGSSVLNTNDFVLNASVSQPLWKGRLIAKVEGFDLLHQLSSVDYSVNAQGRTETWARSLPHYVMLHLVFHFNRKPKR